MISAPDLHTFLRSRRSVRRLGGGTIPDNVIRRMLETAASAPSAHNRQPWRFAVVADASARARLAAAMGEEYALDLASDGISLENRESMIEKTRRRILAAPLLIILCLDMSDMDHYPDDRRNQAERIMATHSVANAGATLLLAVHAEGLAGYWNCAPLFAPKAVIQALGLPQHWEPQAMFHIGTPQDRPGERPRRAINEVSITI